MISTAHILKQLDRALLNRAIIRLELEDFIERANDEDLDQVVTAVCHLLEWDDRPWEGVDVINDCTVFLGQQEANWTVDTANIRTNVFEKIQRMCRQRAIPLSFATKVNILSEPEVEDSNHEAQVLQLLHDLQNDSTVTTLRLRMNHTTLATLEALSQLFTADDRVWQHVNLDLSSSWNSDLFEGDQSRWHRSLEEASFLMQHTARQRNVFFKEQQK